MMDFIEKCGCKGIRTCLICETSKLKISSPMEDKEKLEYWYCPQCELCWPVGLDYETSIPLHLSRLILIPDLLTVKEEVETVAAIDQLSWSTSQSGRRKQDFGPKVNFKKKKIKVGEFKGFPHFAKNLIKRLQHHEELVDFCPVEVCHLEYTPSRGSAIDPHIDDTWVWGERLVTINLVSPTVLRLTPANLQSCDCVTQSLKKFNEDHFNKDWSCKHKKPSLIKDACSVYRTSSDNEKIEICVPLPERSLVVVAGCSRYNWFHEIQRNDITSRRLAMTFRELSKNFLVEGPEEELGQRLLDIGRTCCSDVAVF